MRSNPSSRSSADARNGAGPRRAGRAPGSAPSGNAQRFLSARWFRGEKLVWIGNLALLALLGYVLWDLLAHRAEGVKTPVEQPAQVVQTPPPAEKAGDFSGVGSILGATGKDAAADTASHLATQLPLKLLGTIAGDPEVACAIIEDTQGKSQNLYHVGETVTGARVEEIGRNSVVLLLNGQREVLEMAVTPGSEVAAQAEQPKAKPVSPEKVSEAIKSSSPRNFQINKKNFQTMIGSYQAVLKAVESKIKPYDDGTVKGLQINGLDDIGMAAYVGLQNGDVITSVNGQSMDSLQKAWQVLQKARTQPNLDVQLMSGNTSSSLHFSLSGN